MSGGRNVVRDFVAAQPADAIALVTLSRDGHRQEWTFGALVRAAEGFAGHLHGLGVRRGSTVLLLVGNRVEYVVGILACLHLGAAALPCSEQLRAKDLRLRLERAEPAAIVCDARNRPELDGAGPAAHIVTVGDGQTLPSAPAPAPADLRDDEPAFVLFTSGTSGEPTLVVHGQRYVWGQRLQAAEWMAARPGELVWSTAAPGWSKSARNTFLAPWLCGARALLQDRRFDPDERLATLQAEGANVLCMA